MIHLQKLMERYWNNYRDEKLPEMILNYNRAEGHQQRVFIKTFFHELKNHLHHIYNLHDFVSELIIHTNQNLDLLSHDGPELDRLCRVMFDDIANNFKTDMFPPFMQSVFENYLISLHCFEVCAAKSIDAYTNVLQR